MTITVPYKPNADINGLMFDWLKNKKLLNGPGQQELSRDVALEALKNIEKDFRRKAFLNKPVVVALAALFAVVTAVALAVIANLVVLPAAAILALYCGTVIFSGVGVGVLVKGLLSSDISKNYYRVANEARTYIDQLEAADPETKVELPDAKLTREVYKFLHSSNRNDAAQLPAKIWEDFHPVEEIEEAFSSPEKAAAYLQKLEQEPVRRI